MTHFDIPEKKIGLIINPVAGLGGRAGFKGSDNVDNQRRALEAGYKKNAAMRAEECLTHIAKLGGYTVFSPNGEMGGQTLEKLGIAYHKIELLDTPTTRNSTLFCLRKMEEAQVELIVFCGGDGTARDICAGCADRIPVLAIPAGVKMYSGCFAVNPRVAGNLLKNYILGKHCSFELREVMDLDEQFLGKYSVCAKLYGYLSVLNTGAGLQGSKVASSINPYETETLIKELISRMQKDILYIIGPGSTTYQIKTQVCGSGTLIGVDVIKNGQMILKDADERSLISLIQNNEAAQIIVTCIGGAGFVFGRGNQQISADVIRLVGKENIHLAVTKSKLLSLNLRPMYVDTGDAEVDSYLSGYYKISLGNGESTVYKIEAI